MLYVKSTTGKLIFSKSNVRAANFSTDGKYVIASLNDSLMLLNLSNMKVINITNAASYEFGKWGSQQSIFVKSTTGDLILFDFTGKVLQRIAKIKEYLVFNKGFSMAVAAEDSSKSKINLILINAGNHKKELIYSGVGISNIIVDKNGEQLAFSYNDGIIKIGLYRRGTDLPEIVSIQSNYTFNPALYWSFTTDGSHVVFGLTGKEPALKERDNLNLDIWSYQDEYPKSYYLGRNFDDKNIKAHTYLATLNVKTKQFSQLTDGNQTVLLHTKSAKNDYCIVESDATISASKWQNSHGRNYSLCNLKTGELIPLKLNTTWPHYRWNISPSGKYVAYYDHDNKNYSCYDINRKRCVDITGNIINYLLNYQKIHYPDPRSYPLGILSWLNDEEGLLVQGTYDLWRLDPQGVQQPVNLTNEGEIKKIIFTPTVTDTDVVDANDDILLTAFDTNSKDYGFYTLKINEGHKLAKLSMQKLYMSEPYEPVRPYNLKKNSHGFLLRTEQADRSPNYYFSEDLKKFTAISDVRPELQWNWLKSELHTYKDSLGNEMQGLLYKPDNFDSNKKYPVLFGVYEFQSNHLNTFQRPDLGGAMFGIPWMVSNGYLVFLPDIKAIPKYGGDGLTRCIVAAVDHLTQYKWIDTAKLGIAGHSVGGFVTNYAISHCNRFKAALSGAGISNMITASTDLWGDGAVKQEFLKDAVYMMDVDLLDDISAYVRNSPILSAKSVNTPLMLLHNDQDGSVRFEQSRSFFLVLRSLKKPCWWLNYRGKGHHVFGYKEQIDYNTKVIQFFDHYLRAKPMPDWMKEHI